MAIRLLTAQDLEELLGRKYFYRQSIYRMAEDGFIASYEVDGVYYFSADEVITKALQRLGQRIRRRFPWLDTRLLRVKYFEEIGKEIVIYGFAHGSVVSVNTEKETEEELLLKVEHLRKEVNTMPDMPIEPRAPHEPPPPPPPDHGPHGHGSGPEEHHREILDMLRRVEERLERIERKLD
ncbi:hypothetical protein HY032_00075 [Candidatus Gottesmanbacteria bacterium]|nr:hypothetical protein [Candidatus Gottesmanbacteria bacterium]